MTKLLLTLDEFLRQEDTKPYREYVCGEAFEKPMPNLDHSLIQKLLILALARFLESTRLGEVLPEFRCIFGPEGRERALVPDLCFVRHERLTGPYLYAAPDLAIEILSPDHHTSRLLDKVQFYLLFGVRLAWIVDPATRTVTVEAPGEEAVVLGLGDMLDGGEVLPGFSLSVDEIFAQISSPQIS